MSLVIVERVFSEAKEFDELDALEREHQWCLDTRHVSFQRSFFSLDRKLMYCVYEAPDAESVREAQREAGLEFTRIWPASKVD